MFAKNIWEGAFDVQNLELLIFCELLVALGVSYIPQECAPRI